MSSIDPLGSLAAQIRLQASRLHRKETDRAAPGKDQQSDAGTPGTLLDDVVARIGGLSPETPDRRRRAFRIFLEEVLGRELAVENRNALSYQDLVDRVVTSMEGDARLREAVAQAGDALLERARKAGGRPEK